MPQVQLPIFPAGSVEINDELACRADDEQVVYFNGHLPVFRHAKNDLGSFRLFTSQLIVQGSATQGDVAKAFGVPLVAIKRATKLYRERGPAGFYVSARRREGSKLNAEKLEQARALLVQGYGLPVVSAQTGVLADTLRKAINAGRLPAVKKTKTEWLVRLQLKAAP
jgi:transposase